MRKHGRAGQRADGLPRWAVPVVLERPQISLQSSDDGQVFHWRIGRFSSAGTAR